VNTTEATPDAAAEPREESRQAPRPDIPEAAAGGVPDMATGAEGAPQPEAGERRPRRRRRRRRKPVPGMMTAGPAVAGEAAASMEVAAPTDDGTPIEGSDAEPGETATTPRAILHLRNRRRRRRSHAPGLAPGLPETGAAADGAVEGAAAPEGAAPDAPRFSAPRRRRRHAPLSAAATEAAAAASPGAAAGQDAPRPPRSRNRRRRRAASAEGTSAAAGEGQVREQRPETRGPGSRGRRGAARQDAGGHREIGRDGPPRDAAGRDAGPRRDRGDRRRDDRRGGGPGRGRGAGPPRPVERKLYSVDAVVDRGFEDIEEEGSESRRVHWQIVKRTTADQISRKALSAVYVLQRDGQDTEFPNLGAARSAVNKTIVHPERLTLSKAEHAAAKK
jgi:hypothetical protein